MIASNLKRLFTIFIGLLLCLFGAFGAYGDSHWSQRGDFPHCQEACLHAHVANMETLIEDYKRNPKRLPFQEEIDREGAAYRRCLEGCHMALPVK